MSRWHMTFVADSLAQFPISRRVSHPSWRFLRQKTSEFLQNSEVWIHLAIEPPCGFGFTG